MKEGREEGRMEGRKRDIYTYDTSFYLCIPGSWQKSPRMRPKGKKEGRKEGRKEGKLRGRKET
jgi:hypothetical protein